MPGMWKQSKRKSGGSSSRDGTRTRRRRAKSCVSTTTVVSSPVARSARVNSPRPSTHRSRPPPPSRAEVEAVNDSDDEPLLQYQNLDGSGNNVGLPDYVLAIESDRSLNFFERNNIDCIDYILCSIIIVMCVYAYFLIEQVYLRKFRKA